MSNITSSSAHLANVSPSNCPLDPAELNRRLSDFDEMAALREGLIVNDKSYRQQFANLYFVRLIKLRPSVLQAAESRWGSIPGMHRASAFAATRVMCAHPEQEQFLEQPRYVNKVLDVRPGEICYIIGTVYMEMPFKPNILEDITKEVRFPNLFHISC